MNVEDSYEGALRRMQRLERAGFSFNDVPAPPPDDDDRMRDLEELATLACEENERLKEQLVAAVSESEQLQRQLAVARGEAERQQRLVKTLQEMLASAQSEGPPNETLARELETAGAEIERLQLQVTSLQQMLAAAPPLGAQPTEAHFETQPAPRAPAMFMAEVEPEPLPPAPHTYAPDPFAQEPQADDFDPELALKSAMGSGRSAIWWLFAGALAGAAAFVFMLRPWEVRHIVAVEAGAAVAAAPLPKPVEPLPVAKVEPPKAVEIPKVVEVPKVAAVAIPKVEAPRVEVPKVARVVKAKPQRRRPAPKHHVAKAKHTVAKSGKYESRGDDPLAGLNL
jgi:predicted transcriptional regulator